MESREEFGSKGKRLSFKMTRNCMNGKIQVVALLATLVIAGSAAAQEAEPNLFLSGGIGGAAFQTRGGMLAMPVADMDASPVKGAPFCATVVTEHTQSLADGNR